MTLTASKTSIIRELFVRTADQNYIAARWCAANELDTDFLWLAVHALEKYLKAVLLANGRSSKGYHHNIVRLFADVEKFAAPLFPAVLDKPERLQFLLWLDRTPRDFIQHLFDNGNADQRYAIHSYYTWSQDLHMLDRMVFLIRRLIVRLDEPLMPQMPGLAMDLLARDPSYAPGCALPFDMLICSSEADPQRAALLNLNLAFAPSDYPHVPIPGRTASSNSVLIRRILDPLACNHPETAEGLEIADWVLANIHLPKASKAEIETAVKKARAMFQFD